MKFPGGSEVKASACNEGDLGSIPGSGRSPGEGNGNPLQYPCLENPMDGGAWWATVHGVAKGRTWLSDFTFTFLIKLFSLKHLIKEMKCFKGNFYMHFFPFSLPQVHQRHWMLSHMCYSCKVLNGCKGKTAPRPSSLRCTHISGYQMCVFALYQANLLYGLHEQQFCSDTELVVSIRSRSKRLSPTGLFLQPISNTHHKFRLTPVLLAKQL